MKGLADINIVRKDNLTALIRSNSASSSSLVLTGLVSLLRLLTVLALGFCFWTAGRDLDFLAGSSFTGPTREDIGTTGGSVEGVKGMASFMGRPKRQLIKYERVLRT